MKGRRIRLFRGMDNEWYFTVVGDNGEPIAASGGESYPRKDDALDTIIKYWPGWNIVDADDEIIRGVDWDDGSN